MRNFRFRDRILNGKLLCAVWTLVLVSAFAAELFGISTTASHSKGEFTMHTAPDGSPRFSRASEDDPSPRTFLGTCNDGWDDRFADNGANGRIYAMVSDGAGNIYIGGEFTTVGNIAASHIAKWDGSNWSTLGTGMNNTVNDLEWSGTDLYALGTFTIAGGTMARRVAKWDGSNWSALGAGLFGNVVNDLLVVGSTVYVAGYNLVTTNSWEVVRWDGTTWSRVGQTFGSGAGLRTLAVIGSDIYAGGGFSFAGGGPGDNIAKLNGSIWGSFGGGMNSVVQRLTVSGTDLYAAGDFTTAGGVPANRIAKWNGSDWSAIGSGLDGTVTKLEISGTNIYAGGSFTTAGGTPANRIAKWDGLSWSGVGGGMNNLVGALAVSGTDVYAGGMFTMAGCRNSTRFARYFNQRFVGSGALAEIGGGSDWFDPANWSNGVVPATGSDATIASADASISADDVTVRDLRIDEGRTLTVAKGRMIAVTRNLNLLGSINGGGTVVVSNCVPSAVTRVPAATGRVEATLVRCVNSSGDFEFPVGTTNGYSPVQLRNVDGNGTVSIIANEGAYSAAAAGLPANRLARWWQIENPGGGIVETDLIFTYQDTDINGIEADYRAYRISDGTATFMPGGINTTTNIVAARDVTQFSDWTLAQAPPTSAQVSLSGRVSTAGGYGIRNAVLTLTAPDGATITARTGSFGYYSFDSVASGETYVLTVASRRYLFASPSRMIIVTDSIADIDFTAEPQ
jgi:hypothetical protein